MKQCPKCKTRKPKSEFNKNRRTYDELSAYCRKCENRRGRKYYQENKKYLRTKTNKYRRTHLNLYRNATKKWRKNNPMKNKQSEKRSRLTPKAIYRRYQTNAANCYRSFRLTFNQFMSFWQKPCFYSGHAIKTIGLDRINNSFGYSLKNVVPCCPTCNSMKSKLTQEQFLLHCRAIVDFRGGK
jgi:hypothetical protein